MNYKNNMKDISNMTHTKQYIKDRDEEARKIENIERDDYYRTHPELWDDVYDISNGSRYSRALGNAFKTGADWATARAEGKVKPIYQALKSWIEWERDQIKKEGPYVGEAINKLISEAEQALKQYETEGK